MFASRLFAYTDGATERPHGSRSIRRPNPVMARAVGVLDAWTRDAFNPRYPHLARRS